MVMITYHIENRDIFLPVRSKSGKHILHRVPLFDGIENKISHRHDIHVVILSLALRLRDKFLHIRHSLVAESRHIMIGLALRVAHCHESEILFFACQRLQSKIVPILFVQVNAGGRVEERQFRVLGQCHFISGRNCIVNGTAEAVCNHLIDTVFISHSEFISVGYGYTFDTLSRLRISDYTIEVIFLVNASATDSHGASEKLCQHHRRHR